MTNTSETSDTRFAILWYWANADFPFILMIVEGSKFLEFLFTLIITWHDEILLFEIFIYRKGVASVLIDK